MKISYSIYDNHVYIIAFMVLPIAFIIFLLIMGFSEEQNLEKYRAEHHCVLIHSNPDETWLEYNFQMKTMMPVTVSGDKFYQCDKDVWKVYR